MVSKDTLEGLNWNHTSPSKTKWPSFTSNNENFDIKNQFQLRGMAILEEYQSAGFGKLLIEEVFNFIQLQQTELLWFNARESAVPFYEKLGCTKKGASFEIPEIGLHFLMYKYFNI